MKKHKSIGLYFAVFAVSFLLAFLFAGSCLICINKFFKVKMILFLLGSTGFGLLCAAIGIICLAKSLRDLKNSKLSIWFGNNYPKLLLGYFILIFTMVSINNVAIWTKDEISDVISIQWTIFGLSLTIFLVWNVIIVEFLGKLQPKSERDDDSDYIQQYHLLIQKRSFSQDVETMFLSIILLTINLFLLLSCTGLIYISAKPESVFTQNATMCSFYFTTNTIATLFIDILKPLKKDKADLLKDNKVTKEDLDGAKAGVIAQAIVDGITRAVMNSEKYTTEEEKKESTFFRR